MTFDDLQDWVRNRLSIAEGDSTADVQIENNLRQEHNRLVEEFNLLVSNSDLAFTADDPIVALPADWLKTLHIYRDGAPVRETNWPDYTTALATGATWLHPEADGITAYLQSGDELRVHPTPETTTATGASIFYVRKPAKMNSGEDTPEGIPDPYHDLLAERTVLRTALDEEEHDIANQTAVLVARLEQDFRRHLARRRGSSRSPMRLRGYPAR